VTREDGATSGAGRARVTSRTAAMVLLVLVTAIGGWLAGSAACSAGRLVVIGELAGRVSVANETGSKVCITPADGGMDRCGALYRDLDDRPPVVGATASVTIARLRTGAAETTEIFILERPVE
jgi:hypothetical protein